MNIAILAYRQIPYISANTAIAYRLGEQLKDMGHNVSFIGYKQDICQNAIKDYNGISVHFLNEKIKPAPRRIENYLYSKFAGDRLRFGVEAVGLKKIVRVNCIDVLICIIAPNDDALIAFTAKLDIPVYLYQLDPFYNCGDITNEKLKKKFLKMLPYFSHVFTTDLLFCEYCEDTEINMFTSKMSVIQFPNLVKPESRNTGRNDKIRFLYSGTLYHVIRNPGILIELKNALPDNCEVVFCGGCDNDEDLKKIIDSGIHYLGRLNSSDLNEEFSKADFLINIGNSVRNQLGSKLIDYISTGKPIINITQLAQCPTENVLGKYEYHITIQANKINDSDTVKALNSFIQNYRGKQYKWERIAEKYCEFTPHYVANCILDRIRATSH